MQNHDQFIHDTCFVPQPILRRLCKTLPTPFYLYDEAGLRRSMEKLQQAFSWSDGFQQFFPMRLMPNGTILELLRQTGCGVQCVSLAELLWAERCGFRHQAVIFSTLLPSMQELEVLQRLGGTLLVDNVDTVAFCITKKLLPQRVLLRYTPGGKFSVGTQTRSRLERSKLGLDEQTLCAQAALLRRNGVQWIGLQADLAKQVLDLDFFDAVLRLLCRAASQLQQRTGITPSALNLGGGVGIGFLPEQEDPDLLVMGKRAQLAMDEGLLPHPIPVQTTIGRALTGPHGLLISRVLAVKQLDRRFVLLDASVGNFMRSAQGVYHHISVVGKTQNAGRVFCDVSGSLPEPDGRFAERRLLPPAVAGDCCVIHDAGFCGSAMESRYGGTPACAEYLYTTQGEVRLIRPAQEPEDVLKAW